MEKVILTPEQALEQYKKLAKSHLPTLKKICEEFSSAANQISGATEGEMIPNITSASAAALYDCIGFLDTVASGGENLIARPPRPVVPVECKAVCSDETEAVPWVSVMVPSFEDEKVLGEWISTDLIAPVTKLWGESKHRVKIRGIKKAEDDTSNNCMSALGFQLDEGEEILAYPGAYIKLKTLDNADWIKVIAL